MQTVETMVRKLGMQSSAFLKGAQPGPAPLTEVAGPCMAFPNT